MLIQDAFEVLKGVWGTVSPVGLLVIACLLSNGVHEQLLVLTVGGE